MAGADQPGLDVAAGGDPRRHHRELERVDDQITLADRRIQRVGLGPLLLVFPQLPRAIRHCAVTL
jgi:hypothetical protein